MVSQELQEKSSQLAESMVRQKQSGNSQAGSLTVARYPGVGCSPFIINDYHSRMVNPCYSRNEKGKHFAH